MLEAVMMLVQVMPLADTQAMSHKKMRSRMALSHNSSTLTLNENGGSANKKNGICALFIVNMNC